VKWSISSVTTLALPAPTYTGTPGDQIIASDVDRQAAIDKALRAA